MEKTICRLTVLFEEPFWVGVYERWQGRRYEVSKITFGAEPKDYEVYDLLLQNWHRLRFSPTLKTTTPRERRINPKRLQREIHSEVAARGIGTKAQQALALQREQGKLERKAVSREERAAEKERRFAEHCEKRREKHRGH